MLKYFRIFPAFFAASAIAAAPEQKAAPVEVFVREVANKDGTYSYLYRLHNIRAFPWISNFTIGEDKNGLLHIPPSAFAKITSKELDNSTKYWGSVVVPNGFEHQIFPDEDSQEENPSWGIFVMSTDTMKYGVYPGESLRGFAVQSKKKEPLFLTTKFFGSNFDASAKRAEITPIPETLPLNTLVAMPAIKSVTLKPSTLAVTKFENQNLHFDVSIDASSGEASPPVLRARDIDCKGIKKQIDFEDIVKEPAQIEREKKITVIAIPEFANTASGKIECEILISASNRGGNRVFKSAKFVLTTTPRK